MDCEIIDIHSHIVPNFDDGATSIEESLEMLKLYASQGVTDIFCTSHSGYSLADCKEYMRQFNELCTKCKEQNININLHAGSEILVGGEYVEDVLYGIEIGAFPKLGNSNCMLVEFYPDVTPREATIIVDKFIEKGYKPIIAHVERYPNLTETLVARLIKKCALVQVNVFSFMQDTNIQRQTKARNLLKNQSIHFIGSDAHGLFHRPPMLQSGVEYIVNNAEPLYAQEILSGNAKKYLL